MAVFLSPGVFPREIDLSVIPSGTGALVPAFIGTAKKGPIQEPYFISNSQQFIDIFGEPFPESYLGYAVLAFFEEGATAYILRVGVECEEGQAQELSDVCIDTSGARGKGWGRISVFTGIDFGKIYSRVISDLDPIILHAAAASDIDFNDAVIGDSGPSIATLTFTPGGGTGYTGSIDDSFYIIFRGEPTTGTQCDGMTIDVVRNSDGNTIYRGVITENTPGVTYDIDIGDGIVFAIDATGGAPLAADDTINFRVQPDNRSFAFNVNRTTSGTSSAVTYQVPAGTYTSADDLAVAINAVIAGSPGEDYQAVAKSDGTVCIQTIVQGRNIQLEGTEAFALEFGVNLYAYDIPRSNIFSTQNGTYDITTENNRVTIEVTTTSSTFDMTFSVPVGLDISAAQLASAINSAGVRNGDRIWNAYAMLTPGGLTQVFIETSIATSDHQYDQMKLMADLSHPKTLRFGEELGVNYPYTTPYKVYQDERVILPESSQLALDIPASCNVDDGGDPASAECASDSAYFANIVGWFVAKSPGTWIDSYKLSLEPYLLGKGVSTNAAGRFSLRIEKDNLTVEKIDDLTFDPRDSNYIGNMINAGTTGGGVNGNDYVQWIPRPGFLNNDPVNDLANFEVRIPGALNRAEFVGGANGIPEDPAYSSELDRVIIGNPAAETGIYAFQNPEVYDLTLLIIPGASSGAVIGQGLQMCQQRGDMMMLIDPPFGLRAQQVVDWHNGILYSDMAQSIDSSYGALYHPWLKIFDQYNGDYIFVPPSGHVSAVYARTARDTETWFAPAGLNRGRLLTPVDTEVDLTQGERDLMYGFRNAVNPIVNFPKDGITVWGQRTLQRRQSALDRVNVRLLLIYIKKNATQFLRQFIFEQNDDITRAGVRAISNSFLADIMARRGLYGYSVVCDERNNTPERIDRNELHVSFFIKPTKVAEFIQLNLVVLRTDASFGADEILAAGGVVTAQNA